MMGDGQGTVDTEAEPVFIVGAARSGTTLLRLILDAHSDLAVCGELHFYDQVSRVDGRPTTIETEEDLERAARSVERTVAFRLLESGSPLLERAVDRLRRRIPCAFDHLHLALMQAYVDLEGDGDERPGEKTPANVRYMERIRRNFPRARFVHLVRDPRGVAASSIDVEANSDDVVIHALTWRCDVYRAREFLRRRSDAVLEVRYEDLVREPRRWLGQLTSFLDIPFQEGMLRYHADAEDAFRVEREPWKAGATRPIYRSSVERWKERLRPVQVRLVETVAGRFLGEYGYEPWEEARVGWGRLAAGWIVAAGKYLAAKLANRSLVPQADKEKRLVGTDTSMLRSVLLRSLTDTRVVPGPDG